MTAANQLVLIVIGIGIFTIGFFSAHTVASSWVGLRADGGKAQATTLYMLAYYMGSSIAGSVGGLFWSYAAWPGVTGFISALALTALVLAVLLSRIAPPAWLRT